MTPRSWLFIPGDSDKKLAKGDHSGADALILDLEDAVAPDAKLTAREKVADYLLARPIRERTSQLWVRINPLSSGLAIGDLVAIVAGAPNGVMLPKADGPQDVRTVSLYLDALEVQHGIEFGTTRILPVATETARAFSSWRLRIGRAGAACRADLGRGGSIDRFDGKHKYRRFRIVGLHLSHGALTDVDGRPRRRRPGDRNPLCRFPRRGRLGRLLSCGTR